jgi:hypothetical protein
MRIMLVIVAGLVGGFVGGFLVSLCIPEHREAMLDEWRLWRASRDGA